MKKVIIILAAALVGLSANAKDWASNITVHAGYTGYLENYKNTEVSADPIKGNIHGILIGADYTAEKIFGSPVDIIAGIDYTFAGGNGYIAKPLNDLAQTVADLAHVKNTYKASQIAHEIQIPVRVGYSYDFGSIKAFAFAGPKLGLNLASSLKWKDQGESGRSNLYYLTDNDGKIVKDQDGKAIKSGLSHCQLYMGIGIGAQFLEHFKVTFSYDGGLLNRYTGEGKENCKITTPAQFCITAGYCF